ncbi:hypothetical protein QF032_001359 [Streptomyces achromogenes]|uniref:hypothetical protein n=1 Tax=Streptomyces achromogenes TaxID=67255 RepID=UPI002784FA45|nr:hypothetical protein [Streptomyces achromogenes]MDQ0829515.1 hypothetical protein [Streptomyces achromogenes]
MSDNARDWVWEHSQSKGVARLVMLAMAERASGPECLVVAGSTWLMQRTGASRNTVLAAMARLKATGEIAAVDQVVGIHSHPVWVLPKAIGHTPTPDPGEILTATDAITTEHTDDPDEWTPWPEIERRVRSRVEACVRQATGGTAAP